MNNIIQNAIATINASNQKNVEGQAQVIIGRILNERMTVNSLDESMAAYLTELNKLSLDVVDAKSVLGRDIGSTPNPNEVTIANAIAKLNEDRQKSVEIQSNSLLSCFKGKQAQKVESDKRIADLVKQLNELTVPTVDASVITGATA